MWVAAFIVAGLALASEPPAEVAPGEVTPSEESPSTTAEAAEADEKAPPVEQAEAVEEEATASAEEEPSAPSPATDGEGAPLEDPEAFPATPAPAESTPPAETTPPVDEREAPVDAEAAEAARAACMALDEQPAMLTCLERVVAEHPATTAAERARGALDLLQRPAVDAGAEPPTAVDVTPPPDDNQMMAGLPAFLKPGRLELGFAGGVLGVWAGGAAGILMGTNADQMSLRVEPWIWVLSTGALAVGGGLAGAATGYGVAHAFDLDQGAAWSFTAGATWGASYVISVLPALYELSTPPWYLTDDIIGVTPLLGAGAGAATVLTLALVLDPEISEISMMNTGGWIGGLAGLLIGFNVSMWSEDLNAFPITTTALSYSLFKTGGLVSGLLAAQLLDLTWGETLVGDFGAALGGLAFTSVAVALWISPAADPTMNLFGLKGADREKAPITFASTMGIAGLATGMAATTAGLWAWHRVLGRPMFSLKPGAIDISVTPPIAIVRPGDGPTFLLPGVAGRF